MPPSPSAVISGITTAVSLAESISKMTTLIPSAPKDLKDKHRWVTVTVFNQTQYSLVYQASYFDSGRFWTAPTNVEPFKEMTFSGCNKNDSILTGVSGAAIFQLQMPKKGGGYETLDIGAGFTNPQSGAFKSSGIFTSSGKAAYEATTDNTSNNTSSNYSGKDTDDKETTINFLVVSSPGQEASLTVTEQIVSGGQLS